MARPMPVLLMDDIRYLVLQHNPVNTNFALDIIGPDVMRVQCGQFGLVMSIGCRYFLSFVINIYFHVNIR